MSACAVGFSPAERTQRYWYVTLSTYHLTHLAEAGVATVL